MVVTLTFLMPICSVFGYDFNNLQLSFNVDYSKYLSNTTKTVLESEVQTILNYEDINYKSVNVETLNNSGQISTKKVEITLTCDGINCESNHINITTKINELLTKKLFTNNSEVEIVVKFKKEY